MTAQEQGDSATRGGSAYGAAGSGSGLPNGVTGTARTPAPQNASSTSMENPNIGDMMLPVDRTGVAAVTTTPEPAEPPYEREPQLGANVNDEDARSSCGSTRFSNASYTSECSTCARVFLNANWFNFWKRGAECQMDGKIYGVFEIYSDPRGTGI